MITTTKPAPRLAARPGSARRARRPLRTWLVAGAAYLIAIIFLLPYLEMFVIAGRPNNELGDATIFPSHFTFHRLAARGAPVEVTRFDPPTPIIGEGYGNEVAHVGDCLRQGLTESPWVPHAQTLAIMGQIDDLRGQLGVQHSPLTAH